MFSFSSRSVLSAVVIIAVLVLVLSNSAPAVNDKSNAALKTVLNSKGYIVASPAANWPYPGGFIVSSGQAATFIDLPSAVAKPQSQDDGILDFPAETSKSSFNLTAILTGMQALVGGNPGFGLGHAGTLTVGEIKAKGSKITYEQATDIVKNDAVKATLLKWLSNPKQKVFIIGEVLTTTDLSASTTSAWNGDVSFNGSTVSNCSNSSNSDQKNKTTAPASQAAPGGAAPGGAATNPPATSGATNGSASPKASGASTPHAAATTGPGGEAHYCSSNNNTITMKTDTPLVFAAGAYNVTRGVGARGFDVQPIFIATKGGVVNESTLPQNLKAAKEVGPKWKHAGWTSTP